MDGDQRLHAVFFHLIYHLFIKSQPFLIGLFLLAGGKDPAPADGKPIDGGFEIISYTGNVNKGTAKVTLKGTGSFGGTITRTFKIKANNVKENWFEKLARMLFH